MLAGPKPAIDDSASLAPQIARQLRQAIVELRLKPGETISEAEVAKRFDVSRQPVREAFIKLAEAGLVAIRPQRGTRIVPISIAAVMNARFVREAVEAAVVREAAELKDGELIATLRDQLAEQRVLVEAHDATGFLALDEIFHRTLAEGIERGFAWSMLEGIKAQMDRVRFLSFEGATPLDQLLAQHEAIVEGIAAGDPDRAEAAMRRHLREILASLPKIAKSFPEFFSPEEAGPAAASDEAGKVRA